MKSETPPRPDIGPRLIEVAAAAGYNMSQLARRLGTANTTITGWKKGVEPRVAYVDEVAILAGESLMYLIRGDRGDDAAPPLEFGEWLEKMAPADLTVAERDTLASVRFRVHHPGPQWYALALAGIRSSPVSHASEIRKAAR